MQRRSSPNALPVLFALLLVGSGAALIALGQRASPFDSPPFPTPAVPPASPAPAAPERTAGGNDWQAILNQWIAAFTSPTPSPDGALSTPDGDQLPVTIDIAAIAARHPAWQLAAELERNPALPINFEAISVPALEVSFSSLSGIQSGGIGSGPSSVSLPAPATAIPPAGIPPAGDDEMAFPRLAALDAEVRTVSDLAGLQAQAQAKQMGALDNFLAEAALRQQQARTEAAAIGLEALGEEMEMARRLRLDALVAPMPPDAIQLRMINLRLQLLQSIFSTTEERDAARAELEEREEQWRQRLQEQAAERVAALLALREQQEQSEQQARTRFAASLIGKNERDAQTREAIRDSHTARVQADFVAANALLRITLPAVDPPIAPGTPIANNTTATAQQSTQSALREPILRGAASVNVPPLPPGGIGQATGSSMPGAVLPGSRPERAQLIAALREKAWRESWRWSGLVARRNNWNWVQQPRDTDVVASDKTSEVMSVLSFY